MRVYTRKNLTSCSKSANKLSTSCGTLFVLSSGKIFWFVGKNFRFVGKVLPLPPPPKKKHGSHGATAFNNLCVFTCVAYFSKFASWKGQTELRPRFSVTTRTLDAEGDWIKNCMCLYQFEVIFNTNDKTSVIFKEFQTSLHERYDAKYCQLKLVILIFV